MRTAGLYTLILLVVFAGAASGQVIRNPSDAVYAGLDGLLPYEEVEPEPPLPADLPPGARAIAERLLAREFTLHASVFRMDPGAMHIVGPSAERLRALVNDGRAELVHTARVSGKAGESPLCYSIGRRHAALRFIMDSAQDVVASHPHIEALQHGLWLSARFGLMPGRGVRVRYRVLVADPPEVERRDTIAGKLDFSSVPLLFADAGVVLRVGETVFVVSAEWSRSLVVALTLTGPEEHLEAVTDLGGGWTMAVGGHLEPPVARGLPISPGFEPTYQFLWRDDEADSRETTWDTALEDVDLDPYAWREGPCGLWFSRTDEAVQTRLGALLRQTAEQLSQRGRAIVSRPLWGKLVLPVSPGEFYRFCRGAFQTSWGGYDMQSGCCSASAAKVRTRFTFAGLAANGLAGWDIEGDLTLVGREEFSRSWHKTALRRTLPTFDGYARDRVRFPLVRDRVFAYGGPLPPDGSLVAGTTVKVELPGTSVEHPSPVTVNGVAAALLPGRPTTLLDIERRQAVTMWQSEGWCGMCIRYPLTGAETPWLARGEDLGTVPWGQVWQGFVAILEQQEDGLLSVRGEARGPAEDLGRFDPLDGEVDLIRQPRLTFRTTLDLAGGGPVAWCPGLTFDVRRLGHAYGFHSGREVTGETLAGEVGFVSVGDGLLEAGGTMILPQGFRAYVSHQGGEVTTDFREVLDGTRIEVTDRGLAFRHSTRPKLIPRRAETEDDPPRSGDGLRTLNLIRERTRRTWRLSADGTLDASVGEGARISVRGVK